MVSQTNLLDALPFSFSPGSDCRQGPPITSLPGVLLVGYLVYLWYLRLIFWMPFSFLFTPGFLVANEAFPSLSFTSLSGFITLHLPSPSLTPQIPSPWIWFAAMSILSTSSNMTTNESGFQRCNLLIYIIYYACVINEQRAVVHLTTSIYVFYM